jgi:phosphatidate cytidylyltransferase
VLRWRIVTAVVLAPLVVLALMLGKWAVLAVVFLLVARAAQELARALQPLPFPAALGSGALPVVLSVPYGLTGALAGVFLSLPWSLFWLSAKPDYGTPTPPRPGRRGNISAVKSA